MDDKIKVLNNLLVEVFDDITDIEETAMKQGIFKDLSLKELHTINAIGMYGSKIMSELAHTMKVTMGTLTITVDKLIKKGYLERHRSDSDRRIVNVRLTKRGKLAFRLHEKFHLEMVQSVVSRFTKEEEETLVEVLGKLNHYLKDICNRGFLEKNDTTKHV